LNSELASLADVRLPGYEQPQLRGEEPVNSDHLEFSTAMQAYLQGDCARAIESLAKVPATATDGIAAKLYSGLCQFQGRELDRAQASFADVVAAGDTPELETAEYFQAQTLLLLGDAAGAKNWLNRTIALHGDYEERAQKQEALLPR
jgi:predicted Zn-dependent protease